MTTRRKEFFVHIVLMLIICVGINLVAAQTQLNDKNASATQKPHNSIDTSASARDQSGQAAFEKIKALTGEWQAPLDDGGKMVNIFTPFAYGTKVFAQEWENGKYITSTIFYVVGSELRADHFCDYKNEPHYRVKFSSADPNTLHFQLRYATNLDTHPVYFHSTTWRIVDGNHLIQDWYVKGDSKPVAPIHMEFQRKELSLQPDGSPRI